MRNEAFSMRLRCFKLNDIKAPDNGKWNIGPCTPILYVLDKKSKFYNAYKFYRQWNKVFVFLNHSLIKLLHQLTRRNRFSIFQNHTITKILQFVNYQLIVILKFKVLLQHPS